MAEPHDEGAEARLNAVWAAAAHYLRVRKNDIHTPLSYEFAEELCLSHPQADGLVVRLAILLHDVGWYGIDEERILAEGFGPNWKQSDVRYLHEQQGCTVARHILGDIGYASEVIERVCAIIDGHDTRPEAHSLEDALVRDADRMWRFTPAGIAIASDWFRLTPTEYVCQLKARTFHELNTETGRAMALRELEVSVRKLRIGTL
ncbi:HD domain-containing protein [Streptomyces bobili]|uniref:HD domain-containing protein n=1 Tax=Streptomyces bobili TaxID=67280 RepID=UPI00380FEB6B